MEDLLCEEDFITQKPYNPWKQFMVFYGIAVLNMLLLYFVTKISDLYNTSLIVTSFIAIFLCLFIPLMPFLMIFYKKKMVSLKKWEIILSESLLMFIYYLIYAITDYIENGLTYFIENMIVLAVFLAYGLLCSLIVILIINRKNKNSLYKNAGLT